MKSKIKISGRDALGWLLIGISILMLGKSISLCFSQDIWYDELFTVGMIEHSYGELIHFTAADVHPPLYYCVTKLFVDLCKLFFSGAGTVIPAKIASVLPYFILLLYSVTFIRKRFGIFTGGMFLFCVISMPQMAAYTVEVRMYGWALLFVTAAFLHAYGCVTAGKSVVAAGKGTADTGKSVVAGGKGRWLHGIGLVLFGLAAAYTQYFACVAVVMVYLYVLIVFWCQDRSRIKEWLVYVGLSIIGYIPWLFALAGQLSAVRENYWILPLTWRSLGGCVKFLMKPAFANETLNVILAVILFTGYVAVVVGSLLKEIRDAENTIEEGTTRDKAATGDKTGISGQENREKNRKIYHNGRVLYAIAGLGVLAGVVIFGFMASILIRPVFVYRYMLPAMGSFWLCFVICLDYMLCKQSRLVQGAMMALTILLVVVGLRDYRAFLGEEEYKILLMKDTQHVLSEIGPDDIVIYNFDQVEAVTSYYLEDTTARYLWNVTAEKLIHEIIGPCETVEDEETIREWLTQNEAITEAAGRHIWFVGSFNSREDIVAQWRECGFTVEEKGSFLLERYWFNLYEIRLQE